MSQDRKLPTSRDVFVNAGALGIAGAFGGLTGLLQNANAQTRAAATDFPKPANLRLGAQLDSRFPVSFATTVSQGLRLVVEYFTAQSQRDLPALAKTLHFPF